MRPVLLLSLLVAILAACTQPRSDRCRRICTREAECVTTTGSSIPFDEKECIAACSVLESDTDNLAKVKKHAECVSKNQVCSAVLECQ